MLGGFARFLNHQQYVYPLNFSSSSLTGTLASGARAAAHLWKTKATQVTPSHHPLTAGWTPRESGGLYTPTALPFHQNFNGTESQRTLPSCEKLQLRILIGFCWGPLMLDCLSKFGHKPGISTRKNTIYWLKFRCLIKVHTASCNLSSRLDIYITLFYVYIYIYLRIWVI